MNLPGSGSGSGALSWRDLMREASARLGSSHEARWIVERATGLEGAGLHAALDEPSTTRPAAHVLAMVERRAAGEPLQYVLGRWGFRSLDLLVDRRVLIPRPETEVVVEVALAELHRLGRRRPLVVDLGTGSGAIALSLAAEVPAAAVWATDTSPAALAVARANLAGLGTAAARIRIAEGSWFEALPADLAGRVDVAVSNPPYVAESEVPDLPPEVAHWEPRDALVAGPSGLEHVAAILEDAPRWLARPGAVVVEIAPHQRPAALTLAGGCGFSSADVLPDLAGRARVLVARLAAA